MRLVTASGDLVTVNERGWPLAGLDYPTSTGNGHWQIELASKPGSPPNLATFGRIYRENPWVFAAVNAIATGLSRIDLHTYKLDEQGDFERVRGDLPGRTGRPNAGEALDRLLQMPEPGVSQKEWIRKILLDRLVYGNGVATQDCPGPASLPTALWHTPFRRIEVLEGDMVPLVGYKVSGGKAHRIFAPDEVLHFGRSGDIDTAVGLSPLAPLRYTIALHDALQRHLNAYFKNAARPSGILKVQPGTSKEAQALIQEQVRKLYATPDQAGKIMVTSAEWQSLSEDPKSSQIIELAKLSREEIAGAFQVPPPVLGILDRAIMSNVSELRSQFVRDVLGPHAAAFEADMNAQVVARYPQWRGYFVKFNMDEILRPDLDARATVYEKMRHVWTVQEMRQLEGRKPLEGEAGTYADTVWMPSGQIPLGLRQPQEDVEEEPEAPPEDTGPSAEETAAAEREAAAARRHAELIALLSRPQEPPTVNVQVEAPQVTVHERDVTVNLPEQKPRTRRVARDENGNIVEIAEE